MPTRKQIRLSAFRKLPQILKKYRDIHKLLQNIKTEIELIQEANRRNFFEPEDFPAEGRITGANYLKFL